MPINRGDYNLEDLQDLIGSYLFNHIPIEKKVDLELQHEYLEKLEQKFSPERFYFLVNLEEFNLTYVNGVESWLGYPDRYFTLEKFKKIIHPSYLLLWSLFTKNLLSYSCSGKHNLSFLKQHFVCTLALKHQKGHYVLVKKTSSVFQFDTKNRLRSYVNECTVLGEFTSLANFNPRIFDTDKGYFNNNEVLFGLIIQDFLGLKLFSRMEIQFARMLVSSPGIKLTEIAEQFNASLNTIETYSKRFLLKARDVFQNDFQSSLDAARFLSNALFL